MKCICFSFLFFSFRFFSFLFFPMKVIMIFYVIHIREILIQCVDYCVYTDTDILLLSIFVSSLPLNYNWCILGELENDFLFVFR